MKAPNAPSMFRAGYGAFASIDSDLDFLCCSNFLWYWVNIFNDVAENLNA